MLNLIIYYIKYDVFIILIIDLGLLEVQALQMQANRLGLRRGAPSFLLGERRSVWEVWQEDPASFQSVVARLSAQGGYLNTVVKSKVRSMARGQAAASDVRQEVG